MWQRDFEWRVHMNENRNEQAEQAWDVQKSTKMEALLGKEHDMVMHSMIPYEVGGALDLYYYPNGIEGTGIATKELTVLPTDGASNDAFDVYELVMFTRHPLSMEDAKDVDTEFGRAHRNIALILNPIARYSADAKLNPNETCEFPAEMPDVGGKCLIFDAYRNTSPAKSPFGLMVIIEVFRSEMEYAQQHGGAILLARLRKKGHYPYSDLDRSPVA